ncbi:hypothetical protein BT96DRAFT_1010609 [Gymnopus androsaceus JB14]|uniref:Uncharacterized protein n=1 Tax=Gymnopus androsaceus JB14 TaxID=1447944 RepID=A0A6A4GAF0_9AGAR|nr:hypothetical protein BT96DRAFT_1010609 [Gymnopus androsaceus JB14]
MHALFTSFSFLHFVDVDTTVWSSGGEFLLLPAAYVALFNRLGCVDVWWDLKALSWYPASATFLSAYPPLPPLSLTARRPYKRSDVYPPVIDLF